MGQMSRGFTTATRGAGAWVLPEQLIRTRFFRGNVGRAISMIALPTRGQAAS